MFREKAALKECSYIGFRYLLAAIRSEKHCCTLLKWQVLKGAEPSKKE